MSDLSVNSPATPASAQREEPFLKWDPFQLDSDDYRFAEVGVTVTAKRQLGVADFHQDDDVGEDDTIAKGTSGEIIDTSDTNDLLDEDHVRVLFTFGYYDTFVGEDPEWEEDQIEVVVSLDLVEIEPDYDAMGNDERMLWRVMCEKLTAKMNVLAPETDRWVVFGERLGWMRRSGYKDFRAEKGDDLLRAILPDTENSFEIYLEGDKGLRIVNSHHDAMGELYYVYPERYVVRPKTIEDKSSFVLEADKDTPLFFTDRDDTVRDLHNDFEPGTYEIVFYGTGDVVKTVVVE